MLTAFLLDIFVTFKNMDGNSGRPWGAMPVLAYSEVSVRMPLLSRASSAGSQRDDGEREFFLCDVMWEYLYCDWLFI